MFEKVSSFLFHRVYNNLVCSRVEWIECSFYCWRRLAHTARFVRETPFIKLAKLANVSSFVYRFNSSKWTDDKKEASWIAQHFIPLHKHTRVVMLSARDTKSLLKPSTLTTCVFLASESLQHCIILCYQNPWLISLPESVLAVRAVFMKHFLGMWKYLLSVWAHHRVCTGAHMEEVGSSREKSDMWIVPLNVFFSSVCCFEREFSKEIHKVTYPVMVCFVSRGGAVVATSP